jgi:hypothetical protein
VTTAGVPFLTPLLAPGADDLASSIFGITVWCGHFEWELIAGSRRATPPEEETAAPSVE